MDKRLYYRLCVSRRIDTWQIVYLLYEDACPIIYQFINMRFRYINVPWTLMDETRTIHGQTARVVSLPSLLPVVRIAQN